ncbi:ParB/RepB/Spo0J family partition protein [Phenylobacterium sp. 58.2.17]|uniref:ParB/RepB/Spo0J family partition protein n=1 Tax=Phenylobacterium sp. 58.2.17 TaxID=2969306 RepID=UPI0022642F9E|nr:ParB N-terminal domain-containing protein [Phenylobacterium sp. 58.2.17]MCX7586576.1 ParB N-terminal domain-containing protein [Phenylobacterium sp. 58.2.17]
MDSAASTLPMRSTEIELPLALIDATDRLRGLDQAAVDELAVSIAETGLVHAITVRAVTRQEGSTRYRLVVGGHRLAAHHKLRRATIRCRVAVLSDLDARQMEVDENLIRAGLAPLDFGRFLAERLEIYAERHPDQVVRDADMPSRKRGRPPKNFLTLRKIPGAYVKAMMGFAEETARDVKLSRQHIYRTVQTWGGLSPEVRDRLQGTAIARNEGLLRQLAALGDKAEQAKVAELLISGEAKTVPEGQARAAGNQPMKAVETPVDVTVKAFSKLWGAASPSARAAILHDLAGRSLPKGYAIQCPAEADHG